MVSWLNLKKLASGIVRWNKVDEVMVMVMVMG